MFIKRLKRDVYDVFVGDRWDNWTRVQRMGGTLKFLSGAYLSRDNLTELKNRLLRRKEK